MRLALTLSLEIFEGSLGVFSAKLEQNSLTSSCRGDSQEQSLLDHISIAQMSNPGRQHLAQ